MARGEFSIDIRAGLQKLDADLTKGEARFNQFTSKVSSQAKKAIAPVGSLERQIQSLNTRIKASSSIAGRFVLQFRKDLLGLSNIFVRRFTFTIATTIEQAMLRVLGLPIRMLKEVIKIGSEFEDAILKTAAVTAGGIRGLEAAFDAVSEAARRMGRESVFTAVEISKAMFELASVGLNVEEQTLAIESAANFATAAQTDLMTSTNLLTQIMKAYGLEGTDLARVSDVLTFAFNTTTINVSRLVEAMKFAAPAGAAFNVEFEDMISVIAGFIDVTKQGGISGRAFRFMLQAIADPSTKAKKAISGLGIAARDVDIRFTPLNKILETFAFSALDATDAAVIFGRRAGPVVISFINRFRLTLAVGNNLLQDFKDKLDLKDNIDLAAKQAEIFRGSLTNQFKLLVSQVTDLFIRMFFNIEGTLKRIVSAAQDMVRFISSNFSSFEIAVNGVTEAVKLLAVTLVSLGVLTALRGIPAFITATSVALRSVTTGAARAAVVFFAFKARLAGLLAILRAGGIIVAFITLFAIFSKASQTTGGVSRSIDGLILAFGQLGITIPPVTEMFNDFVEMLLNRVTPVVRLFAENMILLFKLLSVTVEPVGGAFGFGFLFKGASEELDKISEKFNTLSGDLAGLRDSQRASMAASLAAGDATAVETEKVKDLITAIGQSINSLEDFRNKQIAIKTALTNLIAKGNTFKQAIALMGNEIAIVTRFSEQSETAMFNWFVEISNGEIAMREAKVAMDQYGESTKITFNSFKALTELGRKAAASFTSMAPPEEVTQRVRDFSTAISFMLSEFIGAQQDAFVNEARRSFAEYVNGLTEVEKSNANFIKDVKAVFMQFPGLIGAPLGETEELIIAFAKNWSDIIDDSIPEVLKPFEAVDTKLQDMLKKISTEFSKAIADMLLDSKGFVDAMTRLFKGIFVTMMFNVFQEITAKWQGVMGEDGTFLKNTASTVKKMGESWTIFKDNLTGDKGIMQSISIAFASSTGDWAAMGFGAFNTILQFAEGNWVAGITSAIGLVIGIMGRLVKTVKDIRTDRAIKQFKSFGEISEDLAGKIADLSIELSNANRELPDTVAGIILLGDVIKETGIPDADAFIRVIAKLGEGIQRMNEGILTEAELIGTLNDVIPELITNLDAADAIGKRAFRDLVLTLREMGIEIQAINDFITAQLSAVASGLEKILGADKALFDQLIEALKEEQRLIEALKDPGLSASEVDDLTEKLVELQDIIVVLRSDAALTEDQFDRLGRITVLAFNEMIASGATLTEALAAFGPVLAELARRQTAMGFAGSQAINELLRISRVVEKNKELVEGINGLAEAFEALNNVGLITQEVFDDLVLIAVDMHQELLDAGVGGRDALLLMAPVLEQIRDLAEEYGFAIDDSIQSLIDAADEAGLLADAQETVEDIMSDIRDILSDIRDIFLGIGVAGVDAFTDIGNAGIDAAEDIQEAFDDIEFPSGDPGASSSHGSVPSFHRGGVVPPSPTGDTLANVHAGEIIGTPVQIIRAVEAALGRMGRTGDRLERDRLIDDFSQGFRSINIELHLGRKVFRTAIREEIRDGTIDGDVNVNTDSVFHLT